MGLERIWFSVSLWLRCCISAYALSTSTQNLFFTFLIRNNIYSLPRVNISWKLIIFFKTDCQGLFDKITLLNHINFRLLCFYIVHILKFILSDLVYRFRKIVGKSNFSEQFRKFINRYKRIGYSLDIMRLTACRVVNPIIVDGYASLFNCTTAVRASDSMTASS